MKRTLRSVVTLMLVLALLVGVFSSTVALAAGSLADGTGTPDGSYEGGWLEIEYDDDELCVILNPDVQSLLDINKEEINTIIETVIDAVSVMVIEDIKQEFLDDVYGDGNNDTTGINADTIWNKALDNYLVNEGYTDPNDANAGYINFFNAILDDEAVVDDFVDYLCDLLKTAVKTDVIDRESLPTPDEAKAKIEEILNAELDERIEAKANEYAEVYVNWFFSTEVTAPAELTEDVFGFINGKVAAYVMDFVNAYPNGDTANPVCTAIHSYIKKETETSIRGFIADVRAGNETDEDVSLLINAGKTDDEIYEIIITDADHADRVQKKVDEAIASINSDNAVVKAREAISELDLLEIADAKAKIDAQVDDFIAEEDFKGEAINAVWGVDEATFDTTVSNSIDAIVDGYTVTLDEIDNLDTDLSFADFLGYLESATVNGVLVFGDFGDGTYAFSLSALAELVNTLPRPNEIKDMEDTEMQIVWPVSLDTRYGGSEFTVSLKIGGGYDKIRTLARIIANNVTFDFSVDGDTVSLDLNLNCPDKFAQLLLKACDTDKLTPELKDKIYSFVTMTGDDMYAFYEDFTFEDLIAMLESVDLSGILDAEFLKDYVDFSDLSDEEIIDKVREYEGYFNTAMKYVGKLFNKVPDRFMDNCLLDLYTEDGAFAYAGAHSFNLENLLNKVSSKYGPLLASLVGGEGNITLDLNVNAHFEKINKVEYFVDGTPVGKGLLPSGASVKQFAPVGEIGGDPIAYWTDVDGNKVDVMPDCDIKLYAVVADGFEIVTSADVSKVYDGEASTVSITLVNAPDGVTFTYSWTKDGEAFDITAASFEVLNVSDSGVYVCTVSDGVNTWVAEAITVSITKQTLANVEWDYTDAFTYDATDKTVSLVLPEGVVAEYEGNVAKNAGTYYADLVSINDTTGNYNLNEVSVSTLEWVINKAVYDMSGVTFANKTVVYDGAYHGITVTGTLPEGVSVSYSQEQYKPGTYTMTATFTIADSENYEPIAPMSATLTITPNNYNKHTYVDNSGNTVVSIESVNGIPVDYELVVSDDSHIYVGFTLEDGSYVTVHVAYNITFARQGVTQPVNDTFTVKLLIPTALRGRENLKIAYVNENGEAEILESTIDGDYILFNTTHFSTYAIVEDAEPPVYPTPTDYTWIWILVACVLGVAVIVLIVILVVKKRKGKGTDGTEPTTPPTEPVEEVAEEVPVEEAPVEEAPVEEAPVEEAPVEEAPVEETPVEEAPVEETPVEEAPKEKKPHATKVAEGGEDKVSRTLIDGETVLVHYRSSFQSRLIQSDENIQDYYSIIKNTLLGYKGVKSRTSWNMESFNKGRVQCAKINIKGKTMVVYLALDPNEYNINKYHFTDVSDKPKLDRVPMMMKVKSDRALKYTVELIREMMSKLEIPEIENVPTVDYHMPYETTEELAKRGLVKVILPAGMILDENANIVKLDVGELINNAKDTAPVPEVVEEPAPEVVEEPAPEVVEEPAPEVVEEPTPEVVEEPVYTDAVHADELVTDEEAEASIEVIKTGNKRTGKLVTINVDTLCENFEPGEVVDLKAMKAKKLVPQNAARVKVLARGTMTEALTVVADKYSLQAVKMITLAGGHAEIEE